MRVLLFVIICTLGKVYAQEHPNILWITIEDTSPQFLGCYGNPDAKTPTIDSLVREGVKFTNAFSTGTVCSPSRTAIITGLKTYETGTGHHRSKYPIPDFIKGFPYYLRQAGYHTSNNKKTDYNVKDEEVFINESWTESADTAGWWNRTAGQPFFSVFNFMDSHQSRTMTNDYSWYESNVLHQIPEAQRIGENDFDLPPYFQDSPEMRKEFARVYNSLHLTDMRISELLDRLRQDELIEQTIIFFFADHGEGIPRAKTNGIAQGYRVPMAVWIPKRYQDLATWYHPGGELDELVDFTDLAPTVQSIAGLELPDYLSGRAFMGNQYQLPPEYLVLSSDRSDNGIDMVRTITDGHYLYSKNFMAFIPELRYIRYMEIARMKQVMRSDLKNGVLDSLQRALFQPRQPEYLFDLKQDVWEISNLAGDDIYAERLIQMKQKLFSELIDNRDVMFLPEYDLGLFSDSITAYHFRLDTSRYALHDILPVAFQSGVRDDEVASVQTELLSHENPIVRYWAITGLMSQPIEFLNNYKELLIVALNDGYPPVEIIASAILVRDFDNELALSKLKKYCLNTNADLALMAINLCIYLDEKKPFVEAIKSVLTMDRSARVRSACMDFLGSLGLVPNTTDYLR